MVEKDLPKEYKGYPTSELLRMWEDLRTPQGIREGTPVEKIEAMRDLLREFKLAPVFQNQAAQK
ncbi:MAG: hypothetical protein ABFD98_12825 [Syntrophobacteraceae bacterium]